MYSKVVIPNYTLDAYKSRGINGYNKSQMRYLGQHEIIAVSKLISINLKRLERPFTQKPPVLFQASRGCTVSFKNGIYENTTRSLFEVAQFIIV